MKTGHHVGHLHARVVDIVLHFHALAARAQHADEGIAQHGIAQVADVRRFVRVDVGVLDDDLPGRGGGFFDSGMQKAQPVIRAIETDVDVSVSGDFERRHAWNRSDPGHQFGGDLARRLLQLLS